jgi:hypothetical protein
MSNISEKKTNYNHNLVNQNHTLNIYNSEPVPIDSMIPFDGIDTDKLFEKIRSHDPEIRVDLLKNDSYFKMSTPYSESDPVT